MPTAYSYLRFSSPAQATGDSIRRQTESTDAWCRKNNVTLDISIRLTDLGVSAYRGKHRENPDTHALAAFLAAVKSGRVQEGSYLILESLDRLTREDIVPAVNLFTSLLMAGIKIVQLHPVEHVYTTTADMTHVMLALVELSRGNSESKMKSERVGAAWRRKQKEAASKIVTKTVPGWISLIDGKLTLNKHADTIRRVYRDAIAGYGANSISMALNREGVPTMGRGIVKGRKVKWSATTVLHILKTRTTIGEYQPYHKRKTPGDTVKGYYPAVIEDADYHRVQAAIALRSKIGRGRKTVNVNLLAGIIRDAATGGTMTYARSPGRPATIASTDGKDGRGGSWRAYPAAEMERGILAGLGELRASDIVGEDDDVTKKVTTLTARKGEIERLIKAWSAKMDDPNTVDLVSTKLGEYTAQLKQINNELAEAQRVAASPAAEALGNVKSLADLIDEDNSDEMRMKIRSAIRSLVSEIYVLITPVPHGGRNRIRSAAVRVQFTGSARHRTYLMWVQPDKTASTIAIPGHGGPGEPDIRESAGQRIVAAMLGGGPEKVWAIIEKIVQSGNNRG